MYKTITLIYTSFQRTIERTSFVRVRMLVSNRLRYMTLTNQLWTRIGSQMRTVTCVLTCRKNNSTQWRLTGKTQLKAENATELKKLAFVPRNKTIKSATLETDNIRVGVLLVLLHKNIIILRPSFGVKIRTYNTHSASQRFPKRLNGTTRFRRFSNFGDPEYTSPNGIWRE